MPIRSAFGDACRDASRDLRRLPSEARKIAGREVQERVADPLAEDVRRAYAGGDAMARPLSGAVKTRVGADPTIVVGGARKLVSGGASGKQLVYGTEFGSGTKPERVTRLARRAAHGTTRRGSRTRGTTAQFADRAGHYVFGTFARNSARTYAAFVDVLDVILTEWEASRNG